MEDINQIKTVANIMFDHYKKQLARVLKEHKNSLDTFQKEHIERLIELIMQYQQTIEELIDHSELEN